MCICEYIAKLDMHGPYMVLRQAGSESEKLTQVSVLKKSKEKFELFSDHNRSLPKQQPGAITSESKQPFGQHTGGPFKSRKHYWLAQLVGSANF